MNSFSTPRSRRASARLRSTLLTALVAFAAVACAPASAVTPEPGTPTSAPRTPTATAATATASATPAATPSPAPCVAIAATNGLRLPCSQSLRATRKPIAVMVDDHPDARPQAGFSSADIVYHAPAEYGIPRYMMVFQTSDVSRVGPVRSARLYYVSWAAEWLAMYAHVGGAGNAIKMIHQIDRERIWDEDQYFWGNYFWRSGSRPRPHNVYTSTEMLRKLGSRRGAKAATTSTPWTFTNDKGSSRGTGRIVVPYTYNTITYRYDRASNRYVRGVARQSIQRDALNGKRIAPANVIVMFVPTRRLPDAPHQTNNEELGRLDLSLIGTGRALVFRNGEMVKARWSKKDFLAHTEFTYDGGCHGGQDVELVRGQIFIQVVPTGTKVIASGTAPTC